MSRKSVKRFQRPRSPLEQFLFESNRVFKERYRQNPSPSIFEVRDKLNEYVKSGVVSIEDGRKLLYNTSAQNTVLNEADNIREDVEQNITHKKINEIIRDLKDIKTGVSLPVVFGVGVVSGLVSTLIFTAFIAPYLNFQESSHEITGAQEHFALCDNGSACNFNNTSIEIYYKNQNSKNKTPFHPNKINRSTMYRPQHIGNGS